MGRPVVDLTGNKYGKLTVLHLHDEDFIASNGRHLKQWMCQCECGNYAIVVGDYLKSGQTKSCGCISKQENIEGQIFGDLLVISTYKRNKKTRCICKCSCGNERDIDYYNLINNKITNCGCKKSKARPQRIKDLTGQKFGRLTVLERDPKDYFTSGGNKIYKWKCVCECGNIVSVDRNKLTSGKTRSCGCLHAERNGTTYEEYKRSYSSLQGNPGKFIDLTGKTFGKLTAIKPVREKNKRLKWLCKCECGSMVEIQSNNLLSGHTQSCGCIDSTGEAMIVKCLEKFGVNYIKEMAFSDCKDKRVLPFDFGIIDNNKKLCGLIEYDGKQHFEVVRFNGMSEQCAKEAFKTGQIHDEIKNSYCKNNNIPLLRIKYSDINNADDLENKIVCFFNEINYKAGDHYV